MTVAARPRPQLVVTPLGGDPPRFRVVDRAGSGEPHIVTLYPAGPICDCEDFVTFGKRRGVACKHTDGVLEYQREKLAPTSAAPSTGPGLADVDVPPPEPPTRPALKLETSARPAPEVPSAKSTADAAAAEQAVLSAIILAKTVPLGVQSLLQGSMFLRESHRLLYDAMCALTARAEPVDPLTLAATMDGSLDRAGGMEYIATLIDVVPTASHAEAHARIVRSHARRRELVTIAQVLATETDVDAMRALIARAQTMADDLGSATASRFRLLSIAQLLALAPPAWLLEHFLPANGLSVLYGAPGSGKSFLALAWALCIATGQPWIDRATQRGTVVYVAAEGSSGLGQRIQAYADSHELVDPDGIHFVHEPVNLREPRDLDALLAGAAAAKPVLFVFDTMARCMAGGDENSAQDVGMVIAAVDRIRRTTGASVLLVHHTGKDGLAERGSSALRGAADAMFALENEAGAITLKCSKQKDAAPVDDCQLHLTPIGSSCVIEPQDAIAAMVDLEKNDRLALDALNAIAVGAGATKGEWKTAAVECEGKSSQMGRATFYRCLKRLCDRKLVKSETHPKRGELYALTGKGISACAVS